MAEYVFEKKNFNQKKTLLKHILKISKKIKQH